MYFGVKKIIESKKAQYYWTLIVSIIELCIGGSEAHLSKPTTT